jgi:hypothetical protein
VRKNLVLTLFAGAVLTIGITAIAPATSTCLRRHSTATASSSCSPFPALAWQFAAEITPKALPKHELAPVAAQLWVKVATSDGTHPSALREMIIDLESNGAIDATGLPVCGRSQLETRNNRAAKQACRKSILGTGTADVEISSSPGPISLPLILFNGGVRAATTTLLIRSSTTAPIPAPLIATVKVQRLFEGLHAVVKIPRIAEGNGSLLDFKLEVKRLFTYTLHSPGHSPGG